MRTGPRGMRRGGGVLLDGRHGVGGRPRGRDAGDRRARRLGDLRRGGPLGGQHERLELARRRARLDRVLGHAGGEAIRGCHRSKSAEVHIGGGVLGAQPRVLGRADVDERRRQRLQAGHRLLLGRVRAARARRSRSSSTRRSTTCARSTLLIGANNYGFADIVQQCVDRLADIAVVVAQLLQRRLRHRRPASPPRGSRPRPTNVTQRDPARQPGDDERRLLGVAVQILVQTYSSPIPSGSGLPLLAERLHAADGRRLRRLEPRRRLGQQHRRRRRSTTRCATRPRRAAWQRGCST